MERIVGDKIIKNGSVVEVCQYDPEDKFIYEVIKVINNKPLFAEEHFERLIASNENKPLQYDFEGLCDQINRLGTINNIYNCNVKVVVDKYNFYVFFIKSTYPTEEEHEIGADVVTSELSRTNPNKKQLNVSFREKANEVIEDNGVFEVLLVNEKGFITEGSRSNVFFVKDNVFYTAPDDLVLKGVTRAKVIEKIYELGYDVVFDAVNINDLDSIDGAFLTGTSIDVYKIRKLNGKEYRNADKIINKISLKPLEIQNNSLVL